MTTVSTTYQGLVYSTLATDGDLAALVASFVDQLPARAQTMLDCLQASDSIHLRRAAHQLKGAAGSYGFQAITIEAAVLERAIDEGRSEEEIAAAVNAVVDLCRRARRGTP